MIDRSRGVGLRRVATLGIAALALSIASARADAVSCGARRVGSAAVSTVNNMPLVTLSANHRPLTLLLDTGAELTVITPAAAERIGAQPPRFEINHQMRGIGGTLSTREVELTGFAVGDVPLQWRRLLVASVTVATASGPVDGLLGADELSDYDVELDFPRHRVTFYDKQSCADAKPDWAGAYSTLVVSRSASDHLFFPVRLDGRSIAAIIDTGAQQSTVSRATARALGIGDAALASDRPVTARGAAGEQLGSRIHRFASLEVGAETVRNLDLVVTELTLQDADIVLGADFLSGKRAWLSYGSKRVFLSGP